MRDKMNRLITKLPVWVMTTILFVANTTNGIFVSKANITESKLTHGFSFDLFKTAIICYTCIVISNFFDKVVSKAYRNKVLNIEYLKYLDKVLNSRMIDIQKLSTGKVFDAVKDASVLSTNNGLYFICIIPTIIPFSTLIYKEFMYNWCMGIISIASIAICFVMTFTSDKLFAFSSKHKEAKARLQEITVDNFMNTKTIKYLGVHKFARQRLVDAQNSTWASMVNVPHILYFRIIDIIGILPLVINIYMARNSIEMIALLVVSNWVLDNMRGYLLNIADNIVELNAQKAILNPLKGDDKDKKEAFNGLALKDVIFDYGKDSIKFHIDSLVINKGDRILVTGVSGEGKSSLANLIAGGINPTTGKVPSVDVYYVWQETECLADTLWNNIVFDNPHCIGKEVILDMFKELNMFDWFLTLKDGFDTQIGEKGCKLSSGQKQRINIVRCLLNMRYDSNKLFIMDEITSNLDEETKALALACFKKEIQDNKISAIIISHNDGFDEIANRHIVVENHEFIEQ